MRIGIDVGGTNTDAVILDGDRVVAACKSPTTEDVSSGISAVLSAVLGESCVAVSAIDAVMIGTTHFTNAVIERRRLLQVAAVRIGLPATKGVPPMTDWPRDLADVLGRHCYMLHGGHEFDGREIAPLDEAGLQEVARAINAKGLRSAAITSVFSPVTAVMELRAAEILRTECPGIALSLSHEIGRVGFLERENAAIMNACLADLSKKVVDSFRSALRQKGIVAPFFISQNDGTLMTPEHVESYPVLTFASGPTNSTRLEVLEALDRKEEAQAFRWSCFESTPDKPHEEFSGDASTYRVSTVSIDRKTLDLEALRPFFTQEALRDAVRGHLGEFGYRRTISGVVYENQENSK